MNRFSRAVFHLILALCSFVLSEKLDYKGYKIYKVTPQDEQQSEALYKLYLSNHNLDFLNLVKLSNESMHVIVPPGDQRNFESVLLHDSIKFQVVNGDLSETIRAEQRPRPRMDPIDIQLKFNQYYYYNEINNYLDTLAKKYPSRVEVETIGYSYERKPINAITISNKKPGKRPVILIDAGVHAREWLAPVIALYIIYQLVEKCLQNQDLLIYDWIIVPMVNPDGYHYSHFKDRLWRKTRKPNFINESQRKCYWSGVVIDTCTGRYERLTSGHPQGKAKLIRGYGTDINRNFESHWAEVGSSADGCQPSYHGSSAFSESETQAVRDLMNSLIGRVKMYLSLHSYGSYLLYPRGYSQAPSENWREIDEVARIGAAAIENLDGRKYLVGSTSQIMYQASGNSIDYALEEMKIPISLTMELPFGGRGFDPPTEDIKSLAKETWWGIKAMARKVQEKYD